METENAISIVDFQDSRYLVRGVIYSARLPALNSHRNPNNIRDILIFD
jgi:hypothetical protein